MRTFEDVELGRTLELGTHTFTAEDIVRFASAWDPQAFHVDAAAAKASHFGGLCASGWHTACVWMRLMVDTVLAAPPDARWEAGPSPGFQDMRWLKPVFAGDTIRYTTTPIEKRALATRPGWGLLTSRNEGFRADDGTPVFRFTGMVFIKRRS